MTRALLAAALVAGFGLPAAARADDPRLVDKLFKDNEVVRVEGRPNVQATIRFAEDEHIENVAIGDSVAWQVTPNKRANLLFVKPLAAHATTNMTVVTDRHTYLFDLVAGPQARNPLYVLSFSYPKEPAAEQVAQAAARAPTAEEVAAVANPAAIGDPAVAVPAAAVVVPARSAGPPQSGPNLAWRTKGSAQLLPAKVSDDGQSTFLQWPTGVTLPAILIKNGWGVEGPVNFAVRGDVIVVDGVPHEFVLRSGKDVANLINDGPTRKPVSPARPATLAQATPAQATPAETR